MDHPLQRPFLTFPPLEKFRKRRKIGAFPLNFRASGRTENGLFCLPLFRRSYFHFFPRTRSRLRQPPTVVRLAGAASE